MAAAVGIAAAAAVPQLTATVERARVVSAARYLAGRMAFARSQAVARSANVAVLVTPAGEHTTLAMYVDGNGNGVRTVDIESAADPLLDDPVRFDTAFPHVVLSLNDPTAPTKTMLLSFSETGTATSATVYLRGRDGSQYAVRILGATGRTRVLRYNAATAQWTEVY